MDFSLIQRDEAAWKSLTAIARDLIYLSPSEWPALVQASLEMDHKVGIVYRICDLHNNHCNRFHIWNLNRAKTIEGVQWQRSFWEIGSGASSTDSKLEKDIVRIVPRYPSTTVLLDNHHFPNAFQMFWEDRKQICTDPSLRVPSQLLRWREYSGRWNNLFRQRWRHLPCQHYKYFSRTGVLKVLVNSAGSLGMEDAFQPVDVIEGNIINDMLPTWAPSYHQSC